jgi:hypothetical protein
MKGKYAARSALRREDDSVRTEIWGYRNNIKRLTNENKRLKDGLAAERKSRTGEARRLKALVDEGVSPELIAVREELERQRDRANAVAADSRNREEKWRRLLDFTTKLLHDITGCTGLEATEAILAALGGPGQIIGQGTGADLPADEGHADKAKVLQRTRGYRSSQKVVDHLTALCRQAAQRRRSSGDRKLDRWRDPS